MANVDGAVDADADGVGVGVGVAPLPTCDSFGVALGEHQATIAAH